MGSPPAHPTTPDPHRSPDPMGTRRAPHHPAGSPHQNTPTTPIRNATESRKEPPPQKKDSGHAKAGPDAPTRPTTRRLKHHVCAYSPLSMVDSTAFRQRNCLVTRPPRSVQMSYFHTAYATSTRGVMKRQASTGSSTTTAAINEVVSTPSRSAR